LDYLKRDVAMPICDNCLLSDKENKNEAENDKLNGNPLAK
jgi:hypothetical protein